MRFTKMQGAGNDYIYIDCFTQPMPSDPAALSRAMSDRHFGVGADGLILICPSSVADARMRMFNADGSEAEMCGNGVRCLAKYVYERGIVRKTQLRVETGRGVLPLELDVDGPQVRRVTVDMGEPILAAEKIPTTLTGHPPLEVPLVASRRVGGAASRPVSESRTSHERQRAGPSPVTGENLTREFRVTCLSMGNPHCVIFVDEPTDELVLGWGPIIERDPHFPRRANVGFVQVVSPSEVRLRVWERGSGETMACGTGACAAVVAGALTGRTERQAVAHLPGGDLEILWAEDGHVYLTGPAEEVFTGDWPE